MPRKMAKGGWGGGIPWLKGEQHAISLCERFNIDATGIIHRIENFSMILETFPRLLKKGS
jgi:hypothetical protein